LVVEKSIAKQFLSKEWGFMQKSMTRRDALKGIAASAAALSLVQPDCAAAQESPIIVAGKPVELALFAASPQTIRVTIQSIENGEPQAISQDGALVKATWGMPLARLRTLPGTRTVKSGKLQATLSSNPLTVKIETAGGQLVQELKVDNASGNLSFSLGSGPLFGLGQGGPQFDRRGSSDQMRSGSGRLQA
jgi:alpha-glucosidase/alpha-D-xyloside xylohydrolase